MTKIVSSKAIAEFCVQKLGAELIGEPGEFSIRRVCTSSGLVEGGIAFSKTDPSEATQRLIPRNSVLLAPLGSSVVPDPEGLIILLENPRLAFAQVVAEFLVGPSFSGIHPTSIIHPSAHIDETASIGEYSIIGPDCVVGAGSVVHRHVVLSRNVTIGKNCVIFSHAVLGEDGFGVETDSNGNLLRIPHLGGVVVGDFVQIGNFTAVASGTIEPTIIGDYTMIDNLVHVAHNVRIGRNCQIIACSEISGSVTIGDRAWIAPNAAILQKLQIGAGAVVGLGAAVTKSVEPSTVVAGVPARVIKRLEGP
ncbi:hypothetical protein [Ancylobacter polymorphus]|uniref:Mannose-1-phosphate guanyltransferase C-terminal domain-containing protein n=1 Tax=Ancylobacter polymorphus TaxID=223390 RepID=A0A9E7D630_9HYPH|nr:hypothetical protein [Ancylobacter polymorphus]UOK71750.1 hypothetical protein K9D25_03205 [Ancylobacter polymorphus]